MTLSIIQKGARLDLYIQLRSTGLTATIENWVMEFNIEFSNYITRFHKIII